MGKFAVSRWESFFSLFFIFFFFLLFYFVIGKCCRADQPLSDRETSQRGKEKSDLLLYHSIPFADHRPSCLALKIERTQLLGFLLEGRTSRAKSQLGG